NKMKMPVLITLAINGGPTGTGLAVQVRSRGTGSGAMSGGWLGASKQAKGELAWMQIVMAAVPGLMGPPATAMSPGVQQAAPLPAPAPPGAAQQFPPPPTQQAPPPQMPPAPQA